MVVTSAVPFKCQVAFSALCFIILFYFTWFYSIIFFCCCFLFSVKCWTVFHALGLWVLLSGWRFFVYWTLGSFSLFIFFVVVVVVVGDVGDVSHHISVWLISFELFIKRRITRKREREKSVFFLTGYSFGNNQPSFNWLRLNWFVWVSTRGDFMPLERDSSRFNFSFLVDLSTRFWNSLVNFNRLDCNFTDLIGF